MGIRKSLKRVLRYTCYCHPRQHYRDNGIIFSESDRGKGLSPHFSLSEGRLIRSKQGTVFICHECYAKERRHAAASRLRQKETPIESIARYVLNSLKYRYIEKYRIRQFQFDFAVPDLRVLLELDGCTYHAKLGNRKESARHTEGTKEWLAHKHGWSLIRVRNGPNLRDRVLEAILNSRRIY